MNRIDDVDIAMNNLCNGIDQLRNALKPFGRRIKKVSGKDLGDISVVELIHFGQFIMSIASECVGDSPEVECIE